MGLPSFAAVVSGLGALGMARLLQPSLTQQTPCQLLFLVL
jgi:hypothetical protein